MNAPDTEPVRFGSHARIFVDNGWPSIIPVRGKVPLVEDWPTYGSTPPDARRLKAWCTAYPGANVGYVLDGITVAIDADISEHNFAPPYAARQADTIAHEIALLADRVMGKTPFVRVGHPPKWMRFYAADGPVPTLAGGGIEVFCTEGSKQVLLDGKHPDGFEYRWVGKASPTTHSWATLPAVKAADVIEFRQHAQEICAKAGFRLTRRPPTGVQPAAGPISFNTGGIVSELLSELLRAMAQAPERDRREMAVEFFGRSEFGERHYHLVAATSALVLSGYSDAEIIEALTPAYIENVPDDPKLVGLLERPKSVRSGMARRGAAVIPLTELDRDFGTGWSIFR